MKRARRSRLSFQSRSIRLLVSASVVGVMLLLGHMAPVAAPGDSPHTLESVLPTRNNFYLFAANGGGTGVSVYAVRVDGSLRPEAGPFAADEGPSGLLASPGGHFLYVANAGGRSRGHHYGDITAYSVRSDGTLRLIGRYGEGVDAVAMTAGPAGHFLYAADAQTGTVRVYRINPGGPVTALGAPVNTGANSSPGALVLTPDGRFLYVADSGSNAISAFRVGPAGALRQVEGSPFSSPRGPDALTIVAAGEPQAAVTPDGSGTEAHIRGDAAPGAGKPAAAGPLSPTQSPPSASCRKDPLAGVYHPWRLHINDPCITVSGTVERVKTEPDHDWHVNLRLPPSSEHLLNGANRKWEHGDLLLEIIPMDQPHIPRPTIGERITVTGAYVLDTDHGWEEIHPVWLVDGSGSVRYTAQAALRSIETGIHGNESYYGKRD